MTRLFIEMLLISLYSLATNAQGNIDTSYFMGLKNQKDLTYRRNGELLGCKQSLECRSVTFVFYSIVLDRQSNRLLISGRILDIGLVDSVGAVGVNIFLAQPENNKLTEFREIGQVAIGDGKRFSKKRFPRRTGDFKISLHFSTGDKLYFEGELYDPVEFDIGQLLKK